jgi:hypothetical protein
MPERILVSLPGADEELRAWAQSFSDMQYTGSLILERATTYLPGEEMDASSNAWYGVTERFKQLIQALDPNPVPPGPSPYPVLPPIPKITAGNLEGTGLDGPIGMQKRGFLGRMFDRFLGYYFSDPSTDETTRRASEAAERHLDLSAVVLDSFGAVSGLDKVCKVAQEGVLVLKHLLEVRRSRGH